MHLSSLFQEELIHSYFGADSLEAIYSDHLIKRTDRKTGVVRRFSGYERISVEAFGKYRSRIFLEVTRKVRQGRYTFNPYQLTYLKKKDGGLRPISKCGLRDFLVQHAATQLLSHIYDHHFLDCSFAYRAKMGPKKATMLVRSFFHSGAAYFLVGDIKEFFDRIDHQLLMGKLAETITDDRILKLVFRYLRTPSVEKAVFSQARNRAVNPTRSVGVPQGGSLSGILSNIYLMDLDRYMVNRYPAYCRYADNFVIATSSLGEAEAALAEMDSQLRLIALEAHQFPKTSIVSSNDRFEFLGFEHGLEKFRPSPSSVKAFKSRVADRLRNHIPNVDPFADLSSLVWLVNTQIRGIDDRSWGAYYCLANDPGIFKRLDTWLVGQIIHNLKQKHNRTFTYSDIKRAGLLSMGNAYYKRFRFSEATAGQGHTDPGEHTPTPD